MPIDIESFTTEVTLIDKDAGWSGQQVEPLIQEIMRRLERKQRDDQRQEKNSSFKQLAQPLK